MPAPTARQRACPHPRAWRSPSISPAYESCGRCHALIPAPVTVAPWVAAHDADNPLPVPALFATAPEPTTNRPRRSQETTR